MNGNNGFSIVINRSRHFCALESSLDDRFSRYTIEAKVFVRLTPRTLVAERSLLVSKMAFGPQSVVSTMMVHHTLRNGP
jgi:hypothetical protein